MTTSADSLRSEIRELAEQHARGDVHQRAFDKQNEKLTVDLCRLLVSQRLSPGETVLAEHHVIRAHTKLAGSVLRESEQEGIALFATDRRLFRLSCRYIPGDPILFAGPGGDQIEEVPFGQIRGIAVRRQIRFGEMMAGAGIVVFAQIARPWLQVTGWAMLLLGFGGILHGLLIPTRWAEVVVPGTAGEAFLIYALRKRSAKKLVRVLRDKVHGFARL